MHRLKRIRPATIGACLIIPLLLSACATTKPVVRDQPVVEQYRMRITKVRNAIDETRGVIAVSRGAPYLPELHMRLAELYSEEARYHYMVAWEREQGHSGALHVPQVRVLKEQAISTYRLILDRYPDTHLADRILFNISHEQRELGLFDEMRTTLENLVKEHPDSTYQAEALLVLGDYHFDRSELVRAEQYYKKLIKLGDSPLLGLAHYKLAWVDVNLSNCEGALDNFESAITSARAAQSRGLSITPRTAASESSLRGEFEIPEVHAQAQSFAGHQSLDVQREALVDLTYCYAQEREPEQATAYLRAQASTREAYVAALSKMANRYALIEQPRGAADVSRELLRLAPDDAERLDDARMLHTAVTRMGDYTHVGEDVPLVLRAMRRQLLAPDLETEAAELLTKEFELVARDLATKSHKALLDDAVESTGKEWTAKPATAEATARAYEAYLDALPASTHRLEMVQNLADVHMEGERYLEAGHRYREAADLLAEEYGTPDEPAPAEATGRADALYNAVVAYQKSLESEGVRGHQERTTARAGLRQAGGRLLADTEPDAGMALRIKFAIAQSYYDEGDYLEAIDLLTAVAYEYPGTEQGDASVHMVLDSYNTINDVSGLIHAGGQFLASGSGVSAATQAQIRPIVQGAEQRRLDELSLAASGDQAGGMEVLLAFADRYKESELGERALLGTFVAARASGDSTQLYALGEEVLARFPSSAQAPGVASSMGQTAAARFEFSQAIQYLEMASQMNPDHSATLLITAGELREQLADRKGALKNYREAIRAAGDGPRLGEAAVHLADLIERGGTPGEVVHALQPLAGKKDPDIASRLGLAMLRSGRHDDAEQHLRYAVGGATSASPAAQARANYGMAEIMLAVLERFEPYPELDAIEETVSLVEVVIQSYLAAARQPDAIYSQASLARLARAAEVGAEKLEQIGLPEDLSAGDRKLVQEAIAVRAAELRAGRDEALAECSQRASSTYLFDDAGLSCLQGIAPTTDPVRATGLAKRAAAANPPGLEEYRERLARNPDDLEALRTVGLAYLDAGDAHPARLVLARTVEVGGDAEDLNLLGVASYQAGDRLGAFDAFGRGKDAGSQSARRNLATMCEQLGLAQLAWEILEGAPETVEGRLIDGGATAGGGS